MNEFVDFYYAFRDTNASPPVVKGRPQIQFNFSPLVHPEATIVFGEKATLSSAFDLNLFKPAGTYLNDLAENRHANPKQLPKSGGANHAMADGTVRYIPWGESTCPINFWAVLDNWRQNATLCRPR